MSLRELNTWFLWNIKSNTAAFLTHLLSQFKTTLDHTTSCIRYDPCFVPVGLVWLGSFESASENPSRDPVSIRKPPTSTFLPKRLIARDFPSSDLNSSLYMPTEPQTSQPNVTPPTFNVRGVTNHEKSPQCGLTNITCSINSIRYCAQGQRKTAQRYVLIKLYKSFPTCT